MRTHTDAKAEESARAINALAYTVGNNIVFGHGGYAPHTLTGSRLLAHELTHVVQQQTAGANAIQAKPDMDQPASSFEREADLMADAVTGPLGKGVGSSTLPYREAIELADCVRIMGERALDFYCLEAVSHEKSRRVCSRSGMRNPLSDMSTFQSPGLSGWWGAQFGCYRSACGRRHKGWDVFAPVGTPVVAAATGTVSRHRDPAGLGDFLKLTSLADPTRAYLYGHLSQREPAGFYCAGNTIGKTGTTGNATADRPHLHLQLQLNGNNVDPVGEFTEPTMVIEQTGSSATVIDKTLRLPARLALCKRE